MLTIILTPEALEMKRVKVATSFPESWVRKSDKQIQLENQGCVFNGQERLDNHELDINKECYCGRKNNETNQSN